MDVPDKTRLTWIAIVVLAVVAVVALFIVINGMNDSSAVRNDSPVEDVASNDDDETSDKEDAEPADADVDEDLDEETETSAPGNSGWKGGASPGPKPSPPAQPGPLDPIIERSTKTVDAESERIAAALESVIANLMSDPDSFSSALLAPDEADAADAATELALLFEGAETHKPLGEVNVFTTMETDVYFTYTRLTVTNGGIRSTRTVGIPLRLVNDTWCLSSLRDTTDDLIFVQHLYL